ncbi:MAG: calcium-binding protein [Rhodobacteraceae bacterium]|nr:calcium-binding protein [Paracoccaceae bacterium]
MPNIILNEDSSFHEIDQFRGSGYPGYIRITENAVPNGLKLYYQAWTNNQATGDILEVPSSSSGATVSTLPFDSVTVKVFVRPVSNFNGNSLYTSFDVTAYSPTTTNIETVTGIYDVLNTPDAPTGLTLSDNTIDESSGIQQVGILTGSDPDNHPGLTYTLQLDLTGQFEIQHNRLILPGGIDYEALDATGLYAKDGVGRIIVELVIRVTDPTGNFIDVTKNVLVSDVSEAVVFNGSSADDIETGSALADQMAGNGGDDILLGKQGDDTLQGGNGDDYLVGGNGNDNLSGQVGDDILKGGNDDDTLRGGKGADHLNGGAGHDTLFGGAGDDWLMDGTGRDKLTGGDGSDVFVFVQDNLKDRLKDFADGEDMIRLVGATDFSQLTVTQTGAGRVEVVFGGATLVVSDTTGTLLATDLTEVDFLFL